MGRDVRLDLLLKEIEDVYVQENFRKLKRYIEGIEDRIKDAGDSSGGDTTIINNINNSPWDKIDTVELPAIATTTVHSRAVATTTCGEYKVCLMEQGGSKTKNFNVKYRKTDTDVTDQIYAKSGDIMNVEVEIVRTPTTIELQIRNNESYVIEADFSTINV